MKKTTSTTTAPEDFQADRRPDPKPRKRAELWQRYLIWDELVQMRKRHVLRLSSISAGKSNLSAQVENDYLKVMGLDSAIEGYKAQMIDCGKETLGDVWTWITSIKGLGAGSLAAQICAQIDDISKFSNISKLWRFAGYAVIDGRREYRQSGEKSHYNARLKSIIYLIGDQFIRQRTPLYSELYYEEKERLKTLHPVPEKKETGKGELYTPGHIDAMARRKMMKIFLQHLWLKWREAEGLPVTMPYAISILGHADYIGPEGE